MRRPHREEEPRSPLGDVGSPVYHPYLNVIGPVAGEPGSPDGFTVRRTLRADAEAELGERGRSIEYATRAIVSPPPLAP